MSNTAQCHCGSLVAAIEGEPAAVVVCHCGGCQRRTGSVFGVSAYYLREQVVITGDAREYVRRGDSGQLFRSYFCPTCGTSLYWLADRDPHRIGVAVGAFVDAAFREPTRSVFEVSKHHWVELGEHVPGFERGRDSTRSR
jgi:hypothetical protein